MNTSTSNNRLHEDPLGPLSQLPTIEATEFSDWTPDGKRSDPKPARPSDPSSTASMDSSLLRLLRAIADNPGLASSKYSKLAHMSPRKAVEVRKQLAKQGLIRETEIQTKARGRGALVLTPTEKGASVLANHGHDQEGAQS